MSDQIKGFKTSSPTDVNKGSKSDFTANESRIDESRTDGSTNNEWATIAESAVEETKDTIYHTAIDPKTDESTVEDTKDTTNHSATDSTVDESRVDEPAADVSAADKPAADVPAADEPAGDEPKDTGKDFTIEESTVETDKEGKKQLAGEKPAVLKELEEAEKQAKDTAKIINELKTRVTELLKKEKHTETEAKELEEKSEELKEQTILFEEKMKRIQSLIAQMNLFENKIPPKTPIPMKHNEDVLPIVIVCGMTEQNIPKLILCDDKKRKTTNITCPAPPRASPCYQPKSKDVNVPMPGVPKSAQRLSDSCAMQEKLAAQNAYLQGMRCKLESDLLNKDQTIECLQRKLCSIQCEMKMLYKQNSILCEKILQVVCNKPSATKHKTPCGKNKSPSPCEIENRLNEYFQTTKLLEKQLCDMGNDVKAMQSDLTAVQAERKHLQQHKKIIICPPLFLPHQLCVPLPPPCLPLPCEQLPCGQPPCGQPPCGQPPCGQPPCGQPPCGEPPCGQPPCGEPPCGQPPCGQLPCGKPPCRPPPC